MDRRKFLKLLAQSSASVGATVFVEKVWGFPMALPKSESAKLSMWGEGVVGISNSSTVSTLKPTKILRKQKFVSIVSGGYTSASSIFFATSANGTIHTWGNNTNFQSGPIAGTLNSPVNFGSTSIWQSISVGGSHCVGIKTDGTLWSWGINDFGQLGQGDVINRSTPIQIGSASNWTQAAAGMASSLAINSIGQLFGVGAQMNGALGNGSGTGGTSALTQIGTLSNWSKISINKYSSFAIKTDNTLWAWGANGASQLGTGNSIAYSSPVQVGALGVWSKIFAGDEITYAIRTDGTLWAWGYNVNGELGIGAVGSKSSPVRIGAGTNWMKIAPSFEHCAALQNDGTLWTWGGNANGQVGNGTAGSYVMNPIQVGTSYWKDVTAVGSISAAIRK